MAYNTLRGTVNFSSSPTGSIESMVDDYSNQTITGIKTFSSTLSASAFWDTTTGTPVTTPAITSIEGDADTRILVSDGDGTATAWSSLTYDGVRLSLSTELTASVFSGSGAGLTDISLAPHKLSASAQLSASNIYYGSGLGASSGQLVAVGNDGITVGASGLSVYLSDFGAGRGPGLSFASGKLLVSPASASAKGALAANDKVLISDSAAGGTFNSTITVLKNYMQDNVTQTITGFTNASNNRVVTATADGAIINGEAALTFNGSILSVTGEVSASIGISASYLEGDGSRLTNVGAGDSAEIAIYGANGTLASDGAFVINSGGGAETAYLTASNLAVSYDAHLNGGTYQKYIIKTINYTLNTHDHIVYLSGAALTASLPAAATVDSIIYHIKNHTTDKTVLIDPNGSETIDLALTKVLEANTGVKIQSINDDRWVILSE